MTKLTHCSYELLMLASLHWVLVPPRLVHTPAVQSSMLMITYRTYMLEPLTPCYSPYYLCSIYSHKVGGGRPE